MGLVFQSTTMAFLGLLLGALFCFMGRKVIGFIIVLLGFAIGFTWGGAPLAELLNSQETWVPWVAGAVGAIIAVIAWKISMFFAGTVIGLFLVRGMFPDLARLAQVVIAFAVGALVQAFKKPIVSLFTAFAGAYMMGRGLAFLAVDLGLIDILTQGEEGGSGIQRMITIVSAVIFTIIGYLFQTRKLED